MRAASGNEDASDMTEDKTEQRIRRDKGGAKYEKNL